MPKITIIIPVYNVEKYLRQCLDSVVNQTYRNLEIICVDDGSQDNSGRILDEYAEKDDRFIVVHQKNQGQSVARNVGMDMASGKYILFVDSDDWIDLNTCNILFDKAELIQSDVLCFQYVSVDNSAQRVNTPRPNKFFEFYDNIPNRIENIMSGSYGPWNKLLRKDFLDSNKIRFIPGLLFEDNPFVFELAMLAKKYDVIPIVLYYYRIGGISVGNKKNNRNLLRLFEAVDKVFETVQKYNRSQEIELLLYKYKLSEIYSFYRSIIGNDIKKEYIELLLKNFTEKDWLQVQNDKVEILPRARAFYQYLCQKNKGHIILSQILKLRWFMSMVFFKIDEIFRNWKENHCH